MKKSLAIILIILIVVLGGIAFTRNEHTAVAPETPVSTEGTVPTGPTTDSHDTDSTRVKGPEQKTIAIGQSGQVGDIIVTINSLVQDSRCPTQVTCIQAGSVTVNVTVSKGTVTATHDINSTGTPFLFEGYSVAIVNVTPVPTTGANTIKLSDYRVTVQTAPTARGDNL